MRKKKKEVMETEKAGFLAGSEQKAVKAEIADEVFELMAKFAGYGFNKSHSAAYGLVTYQTAYLKRYFPEEFMAGLLTCDKEDTDKIVRNVAEVRGLGIEVRRPDVNESETDFSVVSEVLSPEQQKKVRGKASQNGGAKTKKYIRFGLSATKGVGEGAVACIVEAREKAGRFTNLWDFCTRIDTKRVNKKVLEALIKAGAFDDLHPEGNRAAMLASMDGAVDEAQKAERERASGQTSLFGLLAAAAPAGSTPVTGAPPRKYPDVFEWAPKERLAFEKESLGFYISGHPLDRYAADLKRFGAASTASVQERADWDEVLVGGVVTAWKEWPLKSGEGRMAVFSLEDTLGTVKVACFSKAFVQFEAVLKSDEPVLITGKVKAGRQADDTEDAPRAAKELNLSDAVPLSRLRTEKTKQMMLTLPADGLTGERLDQLKSTLEGHKGPVSTVLRVTVPARSYADYVLPQAFSVTPSDELLARLEKLFGAEVARLR